LQVGERSYGSGEESGWEKGTEGKGKGAGGKRKGKQVTGVRLGAGEWLQAQEWLREGWVQRIYLVKDQI
jgi:hypothetical protein